MHHTDICSFLHSKLFFYIIGYTIFNTLKLMIKIGACGLMAFSFFTFLCKIALFNFY